MIASWFMPGDVAFFESVEQAPDWLDRWKIGCQGPLKSSPGTLRKCCEGSTSFTLTRPGSAEQVEIPKRLLLNERICP